MWRFKSIWKALNEKREYCNEKHFKNVTNAKEQKIPFVIADFARGKF